MRAIPALMAADGDMLRKIVLLSMDRHSALLRLFGSEQEVGDLLETAAHQSGEAQHFPFSMAKETSLMVPPLTASTLTSLPSPTACAL